MLPEVSDSVRLRGPGKPQLKKTMIIQPEMGPLGSTVTEEPGKIVLIPHDL